MNTHCLICGNEIGTEEQQITTETESGINFFHKSCYDGHIITRIIAHINNDNQDRKVNQKFNELIKRNNL